MTFLMDENNSKTPQAKDNSGTGNQKIVSKSFTDLDGLISYLLAYWVYLHYPSIPYLL